MTELIEKRLELKIAGGFEKFVSGGKRRIRGLASTDSVDRMGDIVDPAGATWKTPFPLLLQHDHQKPIGRVLDVQRRANGLWIEAEVAEGVGESDDAWKMIEAGLITSYSIGFRALKSERLASGGLRFTEIEIYECSIVTVPANADAVIERRVKPVVPPTPEVETYGIPRFAPTDRYGNKQNFMEAYYAAEKKLPIELQNRCSLNHFDQIDGYWVFKDVFGELVWSDPRIKPKPEPAPVIVPALVRRAPAPAPAAHSAVSDQTKIYEAIKELAEVAAERLQGLDKEVYALQDRIEGMQKALDERRGLVFKGEFQRALTYEEGDVVVRNERLYVATKTIASGGNLREGIDGWVLMIKGVPTHAA